MFSYIGVVDFLGRLGEFVVRVIVVGMLIVVDMNGDCISDFEILIENFNGLVVSLFIL